MRITRNQLRRIIREELSLLSEVDDLPVRGSKVRNFEHQRNIPSLAERGKLWGVADNEGRIALLERPRTGAGIRHTGYVVEVGRSSEGILKISQISRKEISTEQVTFPRKGDPSVSEETSAVRSIYFSRALKDGPDYSSGGANLGGSQDIEKHVKRHLRVTDPREPAQSTTSSTQRRSSGGGQSSTQPTGTSAPKGSKPSPSSRPVKGGSGAPQPKRSGGR